MADDKPKYLVVRRDLSLEKAHVVDDFMTAMNVMKALVEEDVEGNLNKTWYVLRVVEAYDVLPPDDLVPPDRE